MGDHGIGRCSAIFGQQRVGNAVREIAIRFVVNLDELDRHPKRFEMRFDGVNDVARRPIAGIDHQFEWLELCRCDVAEQVIDVRLEDGLPSDRATLGRLREVGFLCQLLDVLEAGIAADRLRATADELHAVVVHRVVAGGHFDAAIDVEMEGCEVDFFCTDHADVDHVDAGVHQAFGKRLLERLAGQADVATHHDTARLEEFAIGAADAPRNVVVELVTKPATDVVGLEAGQGHQQRP